MSNLNISEKSKNLLIATLFILIIVYGMFFGIRQIVIYLRFLPISIFAINAFKIAPPTGKYPKLVLALSSIYIIYIVVQYYFLFVRDVSDNPNFYRAISTSPFYMGLILAPIIEELGFRRVFLSALLKMDIHWLLACSMTAILFVFAHSQNKWAYTAVPGIFFSLIYYFSGSVRLVIFLHFLSNGIFYIDPANFGATRVICDPCLRF